MLPATADLLLAADARRERSMQREMGISALGACRRAAGYQLAGVEPDAPSGSLPAVMGTAIHDAAAKAATQFEPLAMAEFEVEYAGLRGHPDLFMEPVIRDLKTVGRTTILESWRSTGPPRRHVWQVHTYAAAMLVAGYHVTTVQIDYLARDSGDTWLYESPFSIEVVREAMSWLRNVRQTPVDVLARDFRPGSPQCEGCPFRERCWDGHAVQGRDLRSALFVDEPDAALWAKRLEDARARKKEAERDEADARGALDALRPNDVGSSEVEVPGLDRLIRFSVSKPRSRLDKEAVTEDYHRVGAEPPLVYGDATVTVTVVAQQPVPDSQPR